MRKDITKILIFEILRSLKKSLHSSQFKKNDRFKKSVPEYAEIVDQKS
jgi:hypothetical protein